MSSYIPSLFHPSSWALLSLLLLISFLTQTSAIDEQLSVLGLASPLPITSVPLDGFIVTFLMSHAVTLRADSFFRVCIHPDCSHAMDTSGNLPRLDCVTWEIQSFKQSKLINCSYISIYFTKIYRLNWFVLMQISFTTINDYILIKIEFRYGSVYYDTTSQQSIVRFHVGDSC